MFSALSRLKGFRSTSLCFALTYGVIFLLTGSIFLSVVSLGAVHAMERSSSQAIHTESAALMKAWRFGGMAQLREAVHDRIQESSNRENIYLLIDAQSHVLEGNMSCWPKSALRPDEDYAIPSAAICMPGIIELNWRYIPDGGRLLIGRDLTSIVLLKRVLAEALIWAAVMSLALAVGGALVVRKLFKNIVERIAATTDAISQGEISQRVPLTGSEIDSVARTINTMLDRIATLMDSIRNISNTIAHDLRTPITRARNSLEDVTSRETSTERLRFAALNAVKELDHVTAVFEALLSIAKLESGTKRAAFDETDLKPYLADIADLYRPTAEERHIALREELPVTLSVYGDARLLQQAIANLLDNAVKFSPANTEIILKAVLSETTVTLSVQDEGMGMREDELERVAERFYRTSDSQHLPGLGLGLALVQTVAKLHLGTLVITPLSRGLRVELSFPHRREQPEA